MAAHQQIQRIRRLAYNHKYEKNLKQLQTERDTLAQQLDHAQRTTFNLTKELDWLQDAYDRAQGMMTQLHQTNSVLIRFCHGRLQQQRMAIYALEAQLRRGMGGNPPPASHDSPSREQWQMDF